MTAHNPIRPISTALQWYPHPAASENETIDMANSRQIALRIRLRNYYWTHECKPIGSVTVALIRRKMIMVDPKDFLTEEEVTEVLSDHYGFVSTPLGLTIPELDEHRTVAIEASKARSARAGAGGRAKAAKVASAPKVKVPPVRDISDF